MNIYELVTSKAWSERYSGYEQITELLKKDEFGFSTVKEMGLEIPKLLEEPHSLAARKAYKAVSVFMKLESNVEDLKKYYYVLVKQCLKGGVTNRFTYRFAVRIICQMFEKFSNVDDLNKIILTILVDQSKIVKNIVGLLSLLNLFVCKYGPEKIDTQLFVDQICEYATHPNSKIREEALKFFVFVAKWKENSESVKTLINGKLERPQMDRLNKMLKAFATVKEVKFDDILEDSDGEDWVNEIGEKIVRFQGLTEDQKRDVIQLKYGPIFVETVTRNYRWVDRVSKLDEIIFDLAWDKIQKQELPYITSLISNMLNSYNLNVLVKSLKLLGLLILHFKGEFNEHLDMLMEPLIKSLVNRKPAYLIEVSKVYFYIGKHCLEPREYLKLLLHSMKV